MTTGRPVHRFTRGRRVIAPIGVAAMALASLAVGLPSAQASSGAGQRGTDAVFGAWAWSSFTSWQPTPTRLPTRTRRTGRTNPLNLVKIGEGGPGQWTGVYEREVEGGLTTEISDWVGAMPDGEGWVQMPGAAGERWVEDSRAYDETVVDKPAWTETVVDEAAHWQRYSWTGGPHDGDDAPDFPSDAWQPNVEGDPHGVGVEGAYFRSHGGAGNGDWFYLEWVEAVTHTVEHPAETHVVHHPAVAHREFRYERQVRTQGHSEYRWSVYERTYTLGEPPVEDPSEPAEPAEPADRRPDRADRTGRALAPSTPSTPAAPAAPTAPHVVDVLSEKGTHLQDTVSEPHESTQPNKPGAQPRTPSRAVPLSIDAGL